MASCDGLTHRELWQRIMHYGDFDRMPVVHWRGWDETQRRWEAEGLPPAGNDHAYFSAVPMWSGVGFLNFDTVLLPGLPVEVLEETDEYTITRGRDGVVVRDQKHESAVPHFMDWTFKSAAEWPMFKEWLRPDPARIPKNLDERIGWAESSGNPVCIGAASMMGWLRNWMGVENMVYTMFDDPEAVADFVDTMSDLVCWQIDEVMARMSTTPDLAHGWEDIAGSTGPFVSPDLFDKLIAPGYRKIRAKLEEHDIHIYSIDSDGKVEPLIGNWLAAGVNLQFPLEPGTWGCTPEAMRKKFGKELLIQGGFNKFALEQGRDAIDAEIERHIPLMQEGGFVMMPDHLITPGVPLDDYKYYLDRMRNLRF
jgi:Uroporphyrinogen decarboxylase (URO-D)